MEKLRKYDRHDALSTMPEPARQVEDQITSIGFALDTLDTATEMLASRLIQVTGDFERSQRADGPGGQASLVPMAERLSAVMHRINRNNDLLAEVTRELQI